MKQEVLLKKEHREEMANNKRNNFMEDIYADICNYSDSSVTPPPSIQQTCSRGSALNLPPWELSPVSHSSPTVSVSNHKMSKGEEHPIQSSVGVYDNNIDPENNPIHVMSPSTLVEWCPPQPQGSYDLYPGLVTSAPMYSRPSCSDTNPEAASYSYIKPDIPYNAYNMQQYDMELIRCSTPEIMNALASLQTENSKPDPAEQNSVSQHNFSKVQSPTCSSQNFSQNVSVVQENGSSAMFLHLAQRYQDSGYSSDMCMSPVYPYDPRTSSHNLSPTLTQHHQRRMEACRDNLYACSDLSACFPPTGIPKLSMIKSKVTVTQTSANQMPQLRLSCLRGAEDQIQSNDITSSNYTSPVPVAAIANFNHVNNSGNNMCTKAMHKMPPMALLNSSQPVIKKNVASENVPKRKVPSSETKESRESKRCRHNQPLNADATNVMQTWYDEHLDNPYPSKNEKDELAQRGGITVTQVKSWFANKRNRSNNTRPKVQKRQMTEKLMDICHQLARDAKHPSMNNADIIQRLSSIISTPQVEQEMANTTNTGMDMY